MNAFTEHVGDDGELYALGMLADAQRQRIDMHAANCAACAERLGRAEATVALLVDATVTLPSAPQTVVDACPSAVASRRALTGPASATLAARPTRRRPWSALRVGTVAAAVALSIGSGLIARQNVTLRAQIADDGGAFHALLHSHFSHVPFVPDKSMPLTAKVVYDQRGNWFEVIAGGIDPRSHIVAVRHGVVTPVPGMFAARGDALVLALPALGPVSELRLLDSHGLLLGVAHPMFAPR